MEVSVPSGQYQDAPRKHEIPSRGGEVIPDETFRSGEVPVRGEMDQGVHPAGLPEIRFAGVLPFQDIGATLKEFRNCIDLFDGILQGIEIAPAFCEHPIGRVVIVAGYKIGTGVKIDATDQKSVLMVIPPRIA